MRAKRFASVGREGDVGGEDEKREVREREARFLCCLRCQVFNNLRFCEASARASELKEFVGEEITKRFSGAANSRIEK